MEFFVELILELVIQIVGEALFELGLHAVAAPFRKPPNPWFAALGYGLIGAIVGGISLLLFPRHMVLQASMRVLNLVVVPVLAGICMALIGAWRARRGQTVLRIDRFLYGYLFALGLALVRYKWAV